MIEAVGAAQGALSPPPPPPGGQSQPPQLPAIDLNATTCNNLQKKPIEPPAKHPQELTESPAAAGSPHCLLGAHKTTEQATRFHPQTHTTATRRHLGRTPSAWKGRTPTDNNPLWMDFVGAWR